MGFGQDRRADDRAFIRCEAYVTPGARLEDAVARHDPGLRGWNPWSSTTRKRRSAMLRGTASIMSMSRFPFARSGQGTPVVETTAGAGGRLFAGALPFER